MGSLLTNEQLIAEGNALLNTSTRIVSLVPSITEALIDYGFNTVGRTRFCIHPAEILKSIPKVGGTKDPSFERILDLKPNLVIANKEENRKEDIELITRHLPVWLTDINTVEDAFQFLAILDQVSKVTKDSSPNIAKLWTEKRNVCYGRVAYLIWNNPIMVAASDTYINSVLNWFGFENAFQDKNRYPEVSIEDLRALSLDCLFLSSEPYPFKEKHIQEFQRELPSTKVVLVDGEMFSWYGTRMQYVPEYLSALWPQIK